MALFFLSRHKLSHKYVATFTPHGSWRSRVDDINEALWLSLLSTFSILSRPKAAIELFRH